MRRRSGQVISKGRGCWRIRWYLGSDAETGRNRYASETVCGTKRDAERRLAEVLGKAERGVAVTACGTRLETMLTEWLADPAAQGHRRERTLHSYRAAVRKYLTPCLGGLRVDRLDPATVRSRLIHPLLKAGKQRTAQLARDVLSAALEWAAEAKRYGIDANPIRGRVPIRGQAQAIQGKLAARALTRGQVTAFREAIAGDRYELVFLVMLGTGMRPSEVLALQWDDVAFASEERRRWADAPDELARSAANSEGPCLLVRRTLIPRDKANWTDGPVFAPPKTAAGVRVVPLAAELVERLREHRAAQAQLRLRQKLRAYADELVFVGRSGQAINLTSLRARHFKPALGRAGLPITTRLYDLRHSAATHAVMAAVRTGEGVTSVGRWLGHASLKLTLDTYTHPTEEGTRAVSDAVADALLTD